MLPSFTDLGLLPEGIHRATWEEVAERFGGTRRRRRLLEGLVSAAWNLRSAGALWLWLDGSFVTSKPNPGDWDGGWDPDQVVDLDKVDPVFRDLDDLKAGRQRQKAKYQGELLPLFGGGDCAALFFQQTRDGDVKGIVLLDLRTLP
jgi:hypothetical protein